MLSDRLALGDSFFSYCHLLIFDRAEIPESRMPASPVVEGLDVLEDRDPHRLSCGPGSSLEKLALQAGHESLGKKSVVVGGIRA